MVFNVSLESVDREVRDGVVKNFESEYVIGINKKKKFY
jgi:hypothetical protein